MRLWKRGNRRLMLAGLLILLLAASSPAATLSETLVDAVCCDHERYYQALRIYVQIAKRGQPSPQDDYLAGFAALELHQPEHAVKLLTAARQKAYPGLKGWPRTQTLLDRAQSFIRLAPPLQSDTASAPIRIHSRPGNPRQQALFAAMPAFAQIGRSLVGARLPSIDFYLFSDYLSYERFFKAATRGSTPRAWQDGTGTLGLAIFSEQSRGGTLRHPLDQPETIGIVLHEIGHAWMATYALLNFNVPWDRGARRIPLLDEGLAEYIAWLHEPDYMTRRQAWLRSAKADKGVRPAGFDEMLTVPGFYERGDIDQHYWLSGLLMQRVLGERGASRIPQIIAAWAQGASAEQAIQRVTGKSLRAEYRLLIQSLWRPGAR